ncbi:MAG: type II toxin-antitoxin system HicA family toxin [Candidatus Freyrarchaeum guaymaensis]
MSLRPLPAEKVICILKKLGFEIAWQKGSHAILKHQGGRITVILIHKGEK